MTLLENWKRRRDKLVEAKSWQALHGKPDLSGLPVRLSAERSTPPQLILEGRLSNGGSRNHPANDALNEAVLKYLINNWTSIHPRILQILEEQENEALLEAEEELAELQQAINEAKQESAQ